MEAEVLMGRGHLVIFGEGVGRNSSGQEKGIGGAGSLPHTLVQGASISITLRTAAVQLPSLTIGRQWPAENCCR